MPRDRVLTAPEAAEAAKRAKAAGLSVVFTNGCFDILHPGHVFLLERCGELGDMVLVGLNTDRSVRLLKGDDRPVFPLDARARVISSVRHVDWVIPFDEPTPRELISRIEPDVLVKGGDYRADEVVGSELVESTGGRVVIVPLLGDYSTSGILDRFGGISRAEDDI